MTKEKHEHEEAKAKEAPAVTGEIPPQPFPFSASINEPQAVSLPLPQGTKVPVPSISSLNPTETEIGGEDFTLYVSGENIFRDSVINFAGQDEPSTLNEDGTLSTVVKPSLWADPVTVPVIIKNGPESSDPVDFAFNAPAASRSKKKKEE
jgi:IPT/TIG domain